MRIVLATCTTWPELGASDESFAAALRARGHLVEAVPWKGGGGPFAAADAVVVRATWDYHEAPHAYAAWLERLDPRRTFNAPPLESLQTIPARSRRPRCARPALARSRRGALGRW